MDNDLINLINRYWGFLATNRTERAETQLIRIARHGGADDGVTAENEAPYIEAALENLKEQREIFIDFFTSRITITRGDVITTLDESHIPKSYSYNALSGRYDNIDTADFDLPSRQIDRLKARAETLNTQYQVFTDEEERVFNEIINSVGIDVLDIDVDFTELVQKVTTKRATSLANRRATYTYWGRVNQIYGAFIDGLNDNPQLLYKLHESGVRNVPNYIIQSPPVSFKQAVNPKHIIIKQLLTARILGTKLSSKLESLELGTQYSKIDPDTNKPVVEGTLDSAYDKVTEIDELLEDISRGDISNNPDAFEPSEPIDPLLAIILQHEELPVVLKREEIQEHVESIVADLEIQAGEYLEHLADELEGVKEDLGRNLELYAPVDMDRYYFAIMDGEGINVNKFKLHAEGNSFIVTMGEIQVISQEAEEAQISPANQQFTDYQEAVDFINENTTKLMKALANTIYQIPAWGRTFSEPSKRTAKPHETVTDEEERGISYELPPLARPPSTSRSKYGGTLAPTYSPTQEYEVPDNLNTITTLLNKYYYRALVGQNIIYDDLPNFVKKPAYAGLQRNISKDPVNKLIREIYSGTHRPTFNDESFKAISNFVDILNRGISRWSPDISNNFSEFTESIIRLFTVLPDNELRQLNKNLNIYLGAILFDVWNRTKGEEENEPNYQGRSLSNWASDYATKGSGEISLINIARLFQDERFKQYIISDESTDFTESQHKTFINKIYGRSGIITNLIRASKKYKLTSYNRAVLDSLDIIRKQNNLPVYKGQLNVDSYDDMVYTISKIKTYHGIDVFASDVNMIVKSDTTIKHLVSKMGLPDEIIYHIRGLFR